MRTKKSQNQIYSFLTFNWESHEIVKLVQAAHLIKKFIYSCIIGYGIPSSALYLAQNKFEDISKDVNLPH